MAAEPDIEAPVVEPDDMLVRPGTYFNPQTEIVVIVDDSASIDRGIFNMEAYEGADWIRISDEVPVDEDARDESLETFQTHQHRGAAGPAPGSAFAEDDDDDAEDDEDGPDPVLELDDEDEGERGGGRES